LNKKKSMGFSYLQTHVSAPLVYNKTTPNPRRRLTWAPIIRYTQWTEQRQNHLMFTVTKYSVRIFSKTCLHLSQELKVYVEEHNRHKQYVYVLYLGEDMEWYGTSRLCPQSSWLFSTMPQGAMPMLITRPLRWERSNSSASPTCLVTPANKLHAVLCKYLWCTTPWFTKPTWSM
jgi:hypothetical protein